MIKKTVKYEDFNGEQVTEDCYFNLSKAELMEMNFQASGGLENYARAIINARDAAAMMSVYKDLILKAYGVKTPDGKHFMKSDQIRLEFECSPAYSEIYMELISDEKAAAEFFNGIIPKDLAEDPRVKSLIKEGENVQENSMGNIRPV